MFFDREIPFLYERPPYAPDGSFYLPISRSCGAVSNSFGSIWDCFTEMNIGDTGKLKKHGTNDTFA